MSKDAPKRNSSCNHRPRCHGRKEKAHCTLPAILSMENIAEARNWEMQNAISLKDRQLKQHIIDYCANTDHNHWEALCRKVQSGTFTPTPYRIHKIPKGDGSFRKIYIRDNPEDRLVERMLYIKIAPILEKTFCHSVFAYRPGIEMAQMIQEIQMYRQKGYGQVIKADLRKYFDTIDQTILKNELQRELHPDSGISRLLSLFISSKYKDSRTGHIYTMKQGVAQGGILAPILANFYCNPLDRVMESVQSIRYHRYADDILIISKDVQEAENAYNILLQELEHRKLSVNESKLIKGTLTGTGVLGIRFAENNSLSILENRFRNKLEEIYTETSPAKRTQRWVGLLQHYNNIDKCILLDRRIPDILNQKSSNWSITQTLQELLKQYRSREE